MPTRSVTGTLEGPSLGQVLPHEHLVIDYGQMAGTPTAVDEQTKGRCHEVLQQLRQLGVGTVVDCTPPGYGRDLDLLAQLSRETEVRIVASTGSFCEQWHPQPADVAQATVGDLAARFTDELTGAAGRCGVIKVATSHAQITPNEEKLLLAAAATHRATGSPIVSHTTDGLGVEQLDLYASEGVDLPAVLVSHVCSGAEPVDYAIEIAKRGALVGLDRIGHNTHDADHWIDIIRQLHRAHLLDRVLLSHDSVQRFSGPDQIAGHTFSDPTYLNRQFLPALTRAGIPTEAIRQMTHANPQRWLLREGGSR